MPAERGSPTRLGALRRNVSRAGAAVAATVLLLLVIVESQARARPGAADSHHETVRRIAETSIPFSFGEWLGTDVDADPGVLAILRPNVIVHREYTNLRTNERMTLLFVHCSDARDLLGHYPPVCYPAHGLASGPAVAIDWEVGDLHVPAMRYRFGEESFRMHTSIVVDNFMVLPSGEIGRDMDAVDRAARDPRRRGFGAAQIQVVTPAAMTDDRRDDVFRRILDRNAVLLGTLRESPDQGPAR